MTLQILADIRQQSPNLRMPEESYEILFGSGSPCYRAADTYPDSSYLDLLPLVVHVLQPGYEEAAVVARPRVTVLLFLLRGQDIVDLERRRREEGGRAEGVR